MRGISLEDLNSYMGFVELFFGRVSQNTGVRPKKLNSCLRVSEKS